MPFGANVPSRLLIAVLAVLPLLLLAQPVRADGPTAGARATIDLASPASLEQMAAEQLTPLISCNSVSLDGDDGNRFGLVLGERDLTAPGDPRLCLFFDFRWSSYVAILTGQRSVREFRESKHAAAGYLADRGIDPCRIAAWVAADSALLRQLSAADRADAGVRCTPEVIAHGPFSDRRVADVEAGLDRIALTIEEVIGWPLTWPVRVHLYDTHAAFVEGKREEGGDPDVAEESLKLAFGLTTILDNGMLGVMVDTSRFPGPDDLQMLLAHEFTHAGQAGLLGTPSLLPFFIVEGGAEYVASLVVGTEQRDLAARFRAAVNDERANRAVPLRELVAKPSESDLRRTAAAYSRGYAAVRFLTSRWGRDAFTRLHQENVGGSPQRFLMAMSDVTGLTLDQFDQELRAYLLAEPVPEGDPPVTGVTGDRLLHPPAVW
jgi:hypothetical protein